MVHDSGAAKVAAAYNQAGGDYVTYADGDPTHLFEFDGLHAYADRRVWTLLDKKLTDLHANGTRSIRILDAGCGPGTWLRRLVTRARALGFTTITARGFDVARAQIQRARLLAKDLNSHIRCCRSYGRTARSRRFGGPYTLSLQCAQSSAGRQPAEDFRGGRARYLRALHSHGALGRQHSNDLCGFD
jgi:SAM-dependent methyltransferase